jgi:uncharacterized protein with von Willebrand factor type A (vWA) domain
MLAMPPRETDQQIIARVAHYDHSQLAKLRSQPETEVQALQLDQWDIARGVKLALESPAMKALKATGDSTADFHAAAFKPEPQLTAGCADQRRYDFVKTLLDSPPFQELRASTVLRPLASEMSAVICQEQFHALKLADEKRHQKHEQQEEPPSDEEAADQAEIACLRAAKKACQKAQEEMDQLEDMQQAIGLGCGSEVGKPDVVPTEQIAAMFKQVKDNPRLRDIFNRAGRFRRVAQSKQRQKVIHGYDDMVGICLDERIENLLDEELLGLVMPELELDSLRRLSERETLARDYRGLESVGKGPVVVCVDESGSMNGEPITNAKAFALAMGWLARHQKRWVCFVSFSSAHQGHYLAMSPDKWHTSGQAFLSWLASFYNGGTDMNTGLKRLPFEWWPQLQQQGMRRGKTDLIVITDGCVPCAPYAQNFNAWKKEEKVKLTTIILGENSQGDFGLVSDAIFNESEIGTDTAAVQQCFSI